MSGLITLGEKIPEGAIRRNLRKLTGNPIYETIGYLLDVVASLKLPKKKE
jgi:hypothetical protein